MKNYEKTEYPEIYMNTYWGNFTDDADEEIINNRNNFIKDFEIIGIMKEEKKMIELKQILINKYLTFFDHIEIYKTINNTYIFITSPYGLEKNEMLGFKKIYNLYSHYSNTFYIEYEKSEITRDIKRMKNSAIF